MPHRNDTPNMGAGALAYAPRTFRCIEVVHPDGRVEKPATETWGEVSEDCHGLFWQWLLGVIPGMAMCALSVIFISASAFNWSMPVAHRVMVVLAISAVLALISFYSYRFGIGAGALISAVTFAVVATAVPMPELVEYAFAVLIGLSLIASAWSSSIDNVVLEVAS